MESVLRHGDRTSSFQTLHGEFESWLSTESDPAEVQGTIRYQRIGKSRFGATEPLAAREHRAALAARFFAQCPSAHLLPVSDELSARLCDDHGARRIQVGAEPIFELDRVFAEGVPALNAFLIPFPAAGALLRRGAVVEVISGGELSHETARELARLVTEWRERKGGGGLRFLNVVEPIRYREHKRYFVLQWRGRAVAFITAVPVAGRDGWYLADVIRGHGARAGSIELLIHAALRELRLRENAREVRLGLCPGAEIDPSRARGGWVTQLTQRVAKWAGGRDWKEYRPRAMSEFKRRLDPTRWDPLFWVSNGEIGPRAVRELVALHRGASSQADSRLERVEHFERQIRALVPARVPRSRAEFLQRSSVTLATALLLAALHVYRSTPAGEWLYTETGYRVAQPEAWGWFMGPLLHNHHWHFFGDWTSFLVFGLLLEWTVSRAAIFGVLAFGLWASNPVTHFGVDALLRATGRIEALQRFATEIDFGSSNAIYAFVGALAARSPRPLWLLLPFAANGIYLCGVKVSWLSAHHLVALAAGWLLIGRPAEPKP